MIDRSGRPAALEQASAWPRRWASVCISALWQVCLVLGALFFAAAFWLSGGRLRDFLK